MKMYFWRTLGFERQVVSLKLVKDWTSPSLFLLPYALEMTTAGRKRQKNGMAKLAPLIPLWSGALKPLNLCSFHHSPMHYLKLLCRIMETS